MASIPSLDYSLRWTPRHGRHRFYRLQVRAARVTTRYGLVGRTGRQHEREFDSSVDARKNALTKLRTRLNHGYHAVSEGGGRARRVSAPPVQRMLEAVRRASKQQKDRAKSASFVPVGKKRSRQQDEDDATDSALPKKPRISISTASIGVQTDNTTETQPPLSTLRIHNVFGPTNEIGADSDNDGDDDDFGRPSDLIDDMRNDSDLPPAFFNTDGVEQHSNNDDDDGQAHHELMEKLQQTQLTVEQLGRDKAALQDKLCEASNTEQQLRRELQERTDEMDTERRKFAEQIAQIKIDGSTSLQETRDCLNKEIAQLHDTIDELRNTNTRCESELVECARREANLEQTRKQLDCDLTAARELLQAEIQVREEHERLFSARQKELDAMQKRLEIKDRDMRACVLRAVEDALGVPPTLPPRTLPTSVAVANKNDEDGDDDCCIVPAPIEQTPPASSRKNNSSLRRHKSKSPARRVLDLDSLLTSGNVPFIDLGSLESTESDAEELTLNIRGIEVMFRVPGGGAQPTDLSEMAVPSPLDSSVVGTIEAL